MVHLSDRAPPGESMLIVCNGRLLYQRTLPTMMQFARNCSAHWRYAWKSMELFMTIEFLLSISVLCAFRCVRRAVDVKLPLPGCFTRDYLSLFLESRPSDQYFVWFETDRRKVVKPHDTHYFFLDSSGALCGSFPLRTFRKGNRYTLVYRYSATVHCLLYL